MSCIRLAVQSNVADKARVEAALAAAALVRAEEGCLQYELFRSIEFPENLAQLELWESETAYDRHWRRLRDELASAGLLADPSAHLSAPNHHGMPHAPRREGLNGVELYPYARFVRSPADVWVHAEEAQRIDSVRWPAWSAVRIIIQTNMPVEADAGAIKTSLDTRKEPGCLQFEHYRGIEFPENTVLFELWHDPEIYDIHYLNRIKERMFGGATPSPSRGSVERRYGQTGFEWYQHTFFLELDGIWQPENPAYRVSTVRW
jgi:quinol monooxygenase YgiN